MLRRSLVACTAGAIVVGLALTVASSGAVRVWSEPVSQGTVDFAPVDTVVVDTIVPGLGLVDPDEPTTNTTWFGRTVAVVGLMLLLYLAVVVVSSWWRAWRDRERPVRVTARNLVALDPPVGNEVTLDETAQFDALAHGEPRNAIVACWLRLEDDVAAAGWPRQPAETSAEYTSRVLAAAGLDREAVHALAALYREARFSSHPLGEADRDRAATALRTVHESLVAASAPS